MNRQFVTSIILAFTILTGCAQTDHVVTIKTQYGDMVAILYDETPKHKANFIKLAKEHYFDSLLFHRVIEGFMIQGGDPQSKKAKPGERLGNGGPGYNVDAEINPKFFHEKGSLSAARLADQVNPTKASSGSQFYIVQGAVMKESDLKIDAQKYNAALGQFFQNPANKAHLDSVMAYQQKGNFKGMETYLMNLKPTVESQLNTSVEKSVSPDLVKAYTTVGGTPSLDNQYTVFGKVIKGLDVIDKIAAVKKDGMDRPLEDVRMFVKVEEMKKSKIEKLYGYKYPDASKK